MGINTTHPPPPLNQLLPTICHSISHPQSLNLRNRFMSQPILAKDEPGVNLLTLCLNNNYTINSTKALKVLPINSTRVLHIILRASIIKVVVSMLLTIPCRITHSGHIMTNRT